MAASQTYGIIGLADIGSDTLLRDVGQDRIVNAVTTTLAEHNATANALMDTFGVRTTDYKRRMLLAEGGTLQPVDENGRARPTKGTAYDVAIPIHMAADAWGSNYVTLAKMSVSRFAQVLQGKINKDLASIRNLIYGGIFYNASWSFIDPEFGTLGVKPLANGDTDKYPMSGGSDTATDTHFLAQAAAIADATNPFPTIRDELLEHGTELDDVIAFIPTSAQTAVENLTEFVPVSNSVVVVGNGETTIRGNGPRISVPGTVIGYLTTSRTWVVVLRTLPTGYAFAITEGGERPLAFREDREETLRGFGPAGERSDFPYFEEQWIRRVGVGAWNRVGAVALYFGTSGTYAVPTGVTPLRLGNV